MATTVTSQQEGLSLGVCMFSLYIDHSKLSVNGCEWSVFVCEPWDRLATSLFFFPFSSKFIAVYLKKNLARVLEGA